MIATALLLLSAAAPAGGALDTVITLPEVRVESERASEARRRLPTAFVTELEAGASGRALEMLSEVLSEAAGVRIQQYGGLGSFSTVSLRGAPAGQVSIYLDGVPLTSAAHGVVNLADLPATAVERVEVYRGLAPLGLGVATPGGAVNLVTMSNTALREARVARGSFDTWEARATGAQRLGAVSGLVHLGYQGSDGDFPYADDNGTPLNPADDGESTRVNNRFDAATALASISWQPRPGLRVRAREDWFRKAQGLPGLGAVPASDARLRFLRSLSQLEVEAHGAGLWPRVRLRGSVNYERSRFRDPRAKLGLGNHDTDDRLESEHGTLELEWPAAAPRGLALQAAGELRVERARLTDAADPYPDPPGSRRDTRGGALTLRWQPRGGRVMLYAARRWDRQESRLRSAGVGGVRSADADRGLDTPQLGARLAGPLGFELRANWTRAQRAPDFLELFGNQGSVLGNPALRPESAESWDAGAAWAWGARDGVGGALEWAHYQSDARDLVVYMRNSQSSVRAQNVSRARIRGEELSLRLAAPLGLRVSGSFTRQSARDEGDVPFWRGNRLPQRPEREGYLRLDWRRGRLRATGDAHYIGENYLDPANRQRVPDRALIGASLSAALFGEALRVTIEGKNLGDNQVVDVGGFPLPGRSFFVSCETRLAARSGANR